MKNTPRSTRNAVLADQHPSPKTRPPNLADMALDPSVAAAMATYWCIAKPDSKLDLGDLISALNEGISELKAGDMSRAEAMLFAQAHALQCMFVELAGRATRSARLEQLEANMRMALRAQNQCRMTLETLSNVRNPPVVFARQANIAHGPQQVNNGDMPVGQQRSGRRTHAGNRSHQQNELLEASNGQRMDARATRATGRVDPQLAAVERGDRTADR